MTITATGGGGTVTSVTGTANQVAVANSTTTPVISLIGPYTPSTYLAHGVLIGSGTSSITTTAVGATGTVLQGNTGADPTWGTPAASSISITGNTGGALTGAAFTFSGGTTGLSFGGAGSTETLSGTVVLANGGTSASLVASNGGIFYSTATTGAILSGTTTATQMLQSGASTTPAWSTSTWPATTTINQLLFSSSANTITGLATANNGVLITSAGGVPSLLAAGTTGQILTATTGSPASWVAPAASSISITGNSGGALTGNAFTFTGGTTGLTFSGASTTETLTGTLIVGNGGTGAASFTQYMPICGGTNSTNPFQSVATGTVGYVLTYVSSSALPTWQAIPVANQSLVTIYNASTTWTKNSLTVYVTAIIVSGGGGGGSGAVGVTGAAGGGGGGGGSPVMIVHRTPAAAFGSTEAVVIGTGGAGGIAASIAGSGNVGIIGIASSFGSLIGTPGGAGTAGLTSGTSATSTASVASDTWVWGSGSGTGVVGVLGQGGALSTGVNGSTGTATLNGLITSMFIFPSGGAGGGGANSATARQGGVGGVCRDSANVTITAGGTGGIESGTINGGQGNVSVNKLGFFVGGTGGGGGGGQKTGLVAGIGGTGGQAGGGGGGGGGSLTGTNSGAGGVGGAGQVIIIEWFC